MDKEVEKEFRQLTDNIWTRSTEGLRLDIRASFDRLKSKLIQENEIHRIT